MVIGCKFYFESLHCILFYAHASRQREKLSRNLSLLSKAKQSKGHAVISRQVVQNSNQYTEGRRNLVFAHVLWHVQSHCHRIEDIESDLLSLRRPNTCLSKMGTSGFRQHKHTVWIIIQPTTKSNTTFWTVYNGHCFHRAWPVNSKQLLTKEALAIMRYSPENINIDRGDTQSQCWYSLVNSTSY